MGSEVLTSRTTTKEETEDYVTRLLHPFLGCKGRDPTGSRHVESVSVIDTGTTVVRVRRTIVRELSVTGRVRGHDRVEDTLSSVGTGQWVLSTLRRSGVVGTPLVGVVVTGLV